MDESALKARGLTINSVTQAIEGQQLEVPAGADHVGGGIGMEVGRAALGVL